jgi:hypothetical protein
MDAHTEYVFVPDWPKIVRPVCLYILKTAQLQPGTLFAHSSSKLCVQPFIPQEAPWIKISRHCHAETMVPSPEAAPIMRLSAS